MTSDVVRWSQLYSQQKSIQKRDVMTSPGNSRISYRNRINRRSTLQTEPNKSARSSPIATTIQTHFNKIVLLFIWLVINQHVSLVLSEANLATSNFTIDAKTKTGDELNHPSNDDLPAAYSVSLSDQHDAQSPDDDLDLSSQYRSHQIISDDDIANDKHFTSTWAVHIVGGDQAADHVAREHGFRILGKVSQLCSSTILCGTRIYRYPLPRMIPLIFWFLLINRNCQRTPPSKHYAFIQMK